jgi:hypothetical protein
LQYISCNCNRKLTITSQHVFISASNFDRDVPRKNVMRLRTQL